MHGVESPRPEPALIQERLLPTPSANIPGRLPLSHSARARINYSGTARSRDTPKREVLTACSRYASRQSTVIMVHRMWLSYTGTFSWAGGFNAVMAIVSDGQESSSKGSARTGILWIDSNPAQGSGYSFDLGDANGVIGAFPSGWASHFGPVGSGAGVNLAAAPVVAVRKSSGSNVDVDFLGSTWTTSSGS